MQPDLYFDLYAFYERKVDTGMYVWLAGADPVYCLSQKEAALCLAGTEQ